jgi:hypothetical protein
LGGFRAARPSIVRCALAQVLKGFLGLPRAHHLKDKHDAKAPKLTWQPTMPFHSLQQLLYPSGDFQRRMSREGGFQL